MTTAAEQRLDRYAEHASEESVKKIDAKLLRMHRGRIAKIWQDVLALWAMIKDPAAAWPSKAIAIGALVYLISPFDAIPDFIPFFGLSDDAGVILAAVASLAVALAKYHQPKTEDIPVKS
jgi:uncharacterized membrane protein YkvA (DUF1232 family)